MSNTNIQLVEAVNNTFTKNDTEAFLQLCTEDITWNMVGEFTLEGKDAIRKFLDDAGAEPPQFTVTDIFATDEKAVGYGDMQMKNKEGNYDKYSYCDIYKIANGKVAAMITYMAKYK